MIQWKQRLYAFLLRRILGPFLDAASQRKLHESIEVSLQEGTFALNNVGFSLSYLNSLDLGTVSVKRASVKSISIQLTLLEEHSAGDGAATDASVFSSSLAWRAMNLGNKVALMAHVEINGVELELEPLSRNSKAFQARKNGNLQQSPPKIKETTRERDDPTSRSILSSYIEAALASLRLSLNMKDFSVKLCQKSEDQVTTTWVQLRLPSISYQDLDTSRRSQKLPNASGDVQRGFSTHTILEKSVIFQGVSISVGETKLTDDDTDDQDQDAQVSQTSRSPVSTIAVMEGSGQISVRALEMNPSKKETAKTSSATNSQTQVQQTVEARLNQQVKVSVDETSLRQLYIVARGFQKDLVELVDDEGESSCDGDILHDLTTADRVDSDPLDNTIDEMEHYTIEGIMKQYEEARQLAQRHELRGGILLPSNAFEEGDNVGEGDPRTFDVFFDANDKSFHHYASVMKDSILSTDEKFGSDFVHTKIRFHLLGGGIKVSFPNHSHDGLPNVSPDEYILLKFNDLNVVSSLSTNSAEHSIHLSHLEIDDAQIEPSVVIKGDLFHENRVEISNILSFSQPEFDDERTDGIDLLAQSSCISIHASTTRAPRGKKHSDLEVNLKPCEIMYRHGTVSNIGRLLDTLREQVEIAGNQSHKQQADVTGRIEGNTKSFRCNLATLTFAFPLPRDIDCSILYQRYYQVVGDTNNATAPALGITFENLVIEQRTSECRNEVGNDSTLDYIASLECYNILVFVSSPDGMHSNLGRTMRRLDIFAVAGRLEVDPYIPIALEYRLNSTATDGENFGKKSFPVVPPFSSFKARQEDEDEDDEIDRVLSEKLHDISVDTRKALRAKDPQSSILAEVAAADAVLNVHIPEIIMDVSSKELKGFLNILKSVIPSDGGSSPKSTTQQPPSSKDHVPSIAVSVACDTIAVSLHHKNEQEAASDWMSHVLRLDRCRLHTISGGQSMKYVRFLSHETTLYQATGFAEVSRVNLQQTSLPMTTQNRVLDMKKRISRKPDSSATPIFFRSRLFPAISHASPSFLIDMLRPKDEDMKDSEQSVYLSVYNMTYRYDPNSKWVQVIQEFIEVVSPSEKLGPEDTEEGGEPEPENIAALTRLFVSIADCQMDYTSSSEFDVASRLILCLGDLRFSSNIVLPASSLQAFSLSMGDISCYLCNSRYPYESENALLPGAADLMAPSTQSSETVSFRDMGFKTILTLESMDAIIAKKNSPQIQMKECLESTLREPRLTISLTSGELSIYACKDSFQCFTGTIGELQAKMTALTDEGLELLRLKSADTSSRENTPEKERFYDANSKLHPGEVSVHAPDNVPSYPEVYLLDGYDWTTIDHDSNHVTEIPPGEEQVARWYDNSDSALSSPAENGLASSDLSSSMISNSSEGVSPKPNPSLRIIDQHFPVHGASDPLGDGDMEAVKLARSKSVQVETRVLLHDMKVKVRLFDGYDWPKSVRCPATPNATSLFTIDKPPLPEESESKATSTDKAKVSRAPGKKAELLGGLLEGANENESTFGDMPLPEDRVKSLRTQAELRRLSRRTNTYVQFSASAIRLRMDSYAESVDHLLNSCLSLSLGDFFFAETISNPRGPVKMMGEWFSENLHPRDSSEGLLMLKMVNSFPRCRVTPENTVANEEYNVEIGLAPMRCILDQRAVKFAKAFFRSETEEETSSGPEWAKRLHLLPPPFLKMFRVKPVKLKIDYTPQQIDRAALKNGSIVELINISPLDAMVLTLNKVEIENVVGFGDAMGGLVSAWLADICATQMFKFLTNARPFEPLTNIGGGVADLFVLPWDAYMNGEKVSRAIRSSLASLVGTVAHETLTTSSRVTEYIAGQMSKATSSANAATNVSHSSLPSRPLETPKGVHDCAGHALESLARGVQTANYKVIIVPYREYRRTGYRGAVKSVVKGIPIAVAAPVSGASEAISYTLLGARNQIRPDIRKEEEACQRGLHYGSR